jgi:hypothetical protein
MGSTNIKRMCWEKAHILSAQELYYLCILFWTEPADMLQQ